MNPKKKDIVNSDVDKRPRVFVSYSRNNKQRIALLVAALKNDVKLWIDEHDISPGEAFKERIKQSIIECDCFLLLATPEALDSEWCQKEYSIATSYNKSVVPVFTQKPSPPELKRFPGLRNLQYVHWQNMEDISELAKLRMRLLEAPEYRRLHANILAAAHKWEQEGRNSDRVLTGRSLTEAQNFCSTPPRNAPQPIQLMHEFVSASVAALLKEQERIRHLNALNQSRALLENDPTYATLVLMEIHDPETKAIVSDLLVEARQRGVARVELDHKSEYVPEMDVSSIGPLVASAPRGGPTLLWGTDDGVVKAKLEGGAPVSFAATRSLVATVQNDRTIFLWDLEAGNHRTLQHTARITQLRLSPTGDRIVLADEKNRLIVVNTADGSNKVIEGLTGAFNGIKFDPTATRIVTAGPGRNCLLFEPEKDVIQLRHDDIVWEAEFDPTGQWIITSSQDRNVRIWDSKSGKLLLQETFETPCWSARFSPLGDAFVVPELDGAVHVFDFDGNQSKIRWTHPPVPSIRRELPSFVDAAFSPDGLSLITIFRSCASEWCVQTGRLLRKLNSGERGELWRVRVSSFDGCIVTVHSDARIRAWDRLPETYHFLQTKHNRLATSPKGQIVIYDVMGKEPFLFRDGSSWPHEEVPHERPIISIEFAEESEHFVTASLDGTAKVWDPSGKLVTTVHHSDPLTWAKLDKKGRCLITQTRKGIIQVWEVGESSPVSELPVSQNVLDFDGVDTLAFGGEDGTITFISVTTSKQIEKRQPSSRSVHYLNLGPEGQLLTLHSQDRVAYFSTVDSEWKLEGHQDHIEFARMERRCDKIITGSLDGSVRVWSITDKECVAVLPGPANSVKAAIISEDGRYVVTASKDRIVRLWDVLDEVILDCMREHFMDVINIGIEQKDGIVFSAGPGGVIIWKPYWECPIDVARNNVFGCLEARIRQDVFAETAKESQERWFECESEFYKHLSEKETISE